MSVIFGPYTEEVQTFLDELEEASNALPKEPLPYWSTKPPAHFTTKQRFAFREFQGWMYYRKHSILNALPVWDVSLVARHFAESDPRRITYRYLIDGEIKADEVRLPEEDGGVLFLDGLHAFEGGVCPAELRQAILDRNILVIGINHFTRADYRAVNHIVFKPFFKGSTSLGQH
jgi:hypothetical protein